MVNRKLTLVLVLVGFLSVFAQERKDTLKEIPPKYSLSTLPEFWNQMDDIFNDPSLVMPAGVFLFNRWKLVNISIREMKTSCCCLLHA